MALWHCDVVGLPQRCYVFPRYENVCAAHVLWRSARFARGKQCASSTALVSLCALAHRFLPEEISPAIVACAPVTRSTASFIPLLDLAAVRFGRGSCFGETAFESSIGCAVARDKGTRHPAASIGNRVKHAVEQPP